MAPQVLFIGLGNMGRAMVKNLAEKGSLDKPILIFNRTPSRASSLAASLAPGLVEVVPSPDALPAAVERSDVIFSIVANDAAVDELFDLILSPEVAVGDLTGKIFVECSTVSPVTADHTGERVNAAGGTFVASPVFGAPAVAEAGNLIFLPAGPADAIEVLRPLIEGVMGRTTLIPFPDASPGAALKLKLIGNTCVLNMITQMAESLVFAEQVGVGTDPFLQFIDMFFGGVYSIYGSRMSNGTYWKMEKPLFSANGGIKDISHAIDLASSVGVELKNAETTKGYLEQVQTHSDGEREDIAGIYGVAREAAGLQFENDV